MRYVSAVVGLLFGFIVVGPGQEVAAQSVDDSAWIARCKTYPESCVPDCQRDPKFCAKQINDYVLPRFKSWSIYPGSKKSRQQQHAHARHLSDDLREQNRAGSY